MQRFFAQLLLISITFVWIFSGWPKIGNFPPEIKKAVAITHGPFTFDSDGDSDEDAWTFVSDNGPNGLNAPGSGNRAWHHDTNDTASVDVGPTSGQGGSPDGYVFTEASSATAANDTFHMTFDTTLDASANDWEIEFYWNQRGNSNTATVEVQTNENGAGWTDRGTYATGGPDVATAGTQVWNQETLDLTGVISDASTQIRLLVTMPSSGTIWNNDLGLDTITITGTTQNLSPTAPTLHDIPFDNEKTGDSTPDFEFTASDPDGTASIIYQIQVDDDSAFGSVLIDCESDIACSTGAGSFTNTESGGDTSPFNEGERIRFTPTTTMSSGTTYYWRVRAEDDSGGGGSGNYGEYSSTHTVTFVSGTSPSQWFQTTDEQFGSGTTLTIAETTGSDAVQMSDGIDTFTTVGANTWDVPSGMTEISIKAWGAGGGGGGGGSFNPDGDGGDGGGGGFAHATAVSVTPGATLDVWVGAGGGGGTVVGTSTAGGSAGAGGGYSSVETSGGSVLILGAGGGGGGGGDNSGSCDNETTHAGGDGGGGGTNTGSTGQSCDGTTNADGGGGGTQSAGGAAGTGGASPGLIGVQASNTPTTTGGDGGDGTATGQGSEANSGDVTGGDGGRGDSAAFGAGGGGGGGYWGGGGGSAGVSGQSGGGGGGGGSNRLTGTTQSNTAGTTGGAAAGTGDSDYPASTGDGGAGGPNCTDGSCVGTAGERGAVVIIYSAASGSIMSPEIDFDYVSGQDTWNEASLSTTETNGDVKLHVWYTVSTACDTIVPEGTLAGNAEGFDVSASPIDISGLTPVDSTYNKICLEAELIDSSGTPFLNDWTVSWTTTPEGGGGSGSGYHFFWIIE